MRHFIRSLKYAWAYRYRLIISAGCAIGVAVFWSLNISAILPVLEILRRDSNLHSWVDEKIEHYQRAANDPAKQKELAALQDLLTKNNQNPDAPDRENVRRRLTHEIALVQAEQNDANTKAYWYGLLKSQVIRFLPTNQFLTFVWVMVAVVVGVALKGFFDFWQESLVGGVVNRILFDLRNRCYQAVIHQDVRQLGDAGTTDLMARFTNDTEQLGIGMKTLFGRMIVEPLKIVTCLLMAMLISWQLTLIFLILVPLALFTLMKVSRMMRRAARKLLERMADIYKVLRETLDGVRVVKAFTMEPYERTRFRRASLEYYRNALKVLNIDAFAGPMVELLGVAALGLALSAGAYLVLEKERRIFGMNMSSEPLQFPSLLLFYAYLAAVADPVRKLSSVYTKVQAGAVAADRIFAVLDRVPSVQANAEAAHLPRHTKAIEFRNVCFSYAAGAEVLTLDGIHLHVRAGETIALVGPNGCGKTTLLGLLPRFFDPDLGSVLVDGVNIRYANLRSLRKQIGLVTQDTVLFDDTILNNIRYGKPGADREAIEAAAKQAFAHEFILAQPNGYETVVGDRGVNLSGGQKQRIALARAILRNPSILILDEFTSQIDSESEAKIQQALKAFVRGRTTFLITHRLSTLEIADRIVVMDVGKVVAIGSHAELLMGCPLYQRLYEAQVSRSAGDSDPVIRIPAGSPPRPEPPRPAARSGPPDDTSKLTASNPKPPTPPAVPADTAIGSPSEATSKPEEAKPKASSRYRAPAESVTLMRIPAGNSPEPKPPSSGSGVQPDGKSGLPATESLTPSASVNPRDDKAATPQAKDATKAEEARLKEAAVQSPLAVPVAGTIQPKDTRKPEAA
jgi:ATP-binding cassette subfamily B protein/subfamily B ATP-binding cassette protein MsbA